MNTRAIIIIATLPWHAAESLAWQTKSSLRNLAPAPTRAQASSKKTAGSALNA